MGYTRTPDAGRTKTIFLVNGFKNPALRAGHEIVRIVQFLQQSLTLGYNAKTTSKSNSADLYAIQISFSE